MGRHRGWTCDQRVRFPCPAGYQTWLCCLRCTLHADQILNSMVCGIGRSKLNVWMRHDVIVFAYYYTSIVDQLFSATKPLTPRRPTQQAAWGPAVLWSGRAMLTPHAVGCGQFLGSGFTGHRMTGDRRNGGPGRVWAPWSVLVDGCGVGRSG